MAENYWTLKGNNNTDPTKEFVGTTDNERLSFRTGDKEHLRIETDGTVRVLKNLSVGRNLVLKGWMVVMPMPHHPGETIKMFTEGSIVFHNENGTQLAGIQPSQFGLHLSGGVDMSPVSVMTLTSSGNVGIGTPEPGARLHVADDNQGVVKIQTRPGGGYPPALQLVAQDGHSWNLYSIADGTFSIMDATSNATRLVIDRSGNVGIGTWSSGGNLEVNGTIQATGDIVLTGADCAEDFEIDESCLSEAQPGTVMVLDDHGRLRPSATPFDKRVAGVVSGAGNCKPGIILDHQSDHAWRRPLALVGKVSCKVDASLAPIAVGDLLTTSTTPGHAMKALDRDLAFGATLGKALKPLSTGTGMIPILVALQ